MRCAALTEAGFDDALAVADLAYIVLQNQFVTINGKPHRCKRVGQGLAFASEACDLTAALLIERSSVLRPFLERAPFYGGFRDDVIVILDGSMSSNEASAFATNFNNCAPEYKANFEWTISTIGSGRAR